MTDMRGNPIIPGASVGDDLEELACDRCSGMGWVQHGASHTKGVTYPDCPVCEGTGIDPSTVKEIGRVWRTEGMELVCLFLDDKVSKATVSMTPAEAASLVRRLRTAIGDQRRFAEAATPSPPGAVGEPVAVMIARAMCGDDHLACTYPGCGCKTIPARVPAVMAIVETLTAAPPSGERAMIVANEQDQENAKKQSFYPVDEEEAHG